MRSRVNDQELYELAATLLSASADLNKFLGAKNLPPLSYATQYPSVSLSAENAPFHNAKGTIIEAAERIAELARGPRDQLVNLSFLHCAPATLQAINSFKLAHYVPLAGAITYDKIAEQVGKNVTATWVERILKHAMSFGLFAPAEGNAVSHNATSSLLVTDPDLESWLFLCTNVAYPAGPKIPEAIEQYGYSAEANEAAYGISLGRKIAQFERFREPDGQHLHEMFAKAMRGISAGGAYDIKHAVEGGYPWDKLGNSLVVDVGGGPGHVSMALAKKYPELTFEVQDLPETVEVGARNCPEELKSRMTFKGHDFFKDQPAHNVTDNQSIAYFARFILHDWSDKYAQKILQPLASALRPQDKVILNEVVVPEPGELPRDLEKGTHDRDLLMLMNLNGRERTLGAFNGIAQSCTPKLRVQDVHRPALGELSLIELVLDA
ncbi:O-methyltransferase-like protein 8 [Elsinoe australis]|uniref:O-methyltransferase-like protein 8 n=1 Tax=Elsinoe australis TaxID=40998 RepID=A0A4U7B3A5_9PEZI|nr:O-methyltransferase-like protein 8 [Elsinoe australis]